MLTYRAFGLTIVSTLELPGMEDAASEESNRVRLQLVDSAQVQAAWSGSSNPPVWQTVLDDRPFRFEVGRAGDHLFSYGDEATFHANASADQLLCAPADMAAPHWQRVLLDTVLHTVSLLRGFEALHAGAVDSGDGPVALVSATGGGKTSVAAALVRRGYPLFCDDILALKRTAGSPRAYPGPKLMNLPVEAEPNGLPPGWRRLARFPDESWVVVSGRATPPRPLATVMLLERRPGAAVGAQLLPQNPLPLMPHVLGLQHRPDRRRAAFETLSDLAESVPLYGLTADPGASPDEIADVVEGLSPP